MPSLLERFNSKVIRNGENNCWDWDGCKDQKGYGRLGLVTPRGKRAIQAQRIAWMLFKGPIPPGICVCHHCDNPPCTNPNHLFLGTMKENILDMVRKGRCRAGWQNAIKTHCKRGHVLKGNNLVIDSKGLRHCKECARITQRKWINNNREKINSKQKENYHLDVAKARTRALSYYYANQEKNKKRALAYYYRQKEKPNA